MASKGYGITQQDMVRMTSCLIRHFAVLPLWERNGSAVSFSAGRITISVCLGAKRETTEVSRWTVAVQYCDAHHRCRRQLCRACRKVAVPVPDGYTWQDFVQQVYAAFDTRVAQAAKSSH